MMMGGSISRGQQPDGYQNDSDDDDHVHEVILSFKGKRCNPTGGRTVDEPVH